MRCARRREPASAWSKGFPSPLLCPLGTSSTIGVSAPLSRGNADGGEDSDVGDWDSGVERSLREVEPLVAMSEGEDGGSGDRVK